MARREEGREEIVMAEPREGGGVSVIIGTLCCAPIPLWRPSEVNPLAPPLLATVSLFFFSLSPSQITQVKWPRTRPRTKWR